MGFNYAEDNPQYLVCGRNDNQPACSDIAVTRNHGHTSMGDRRVKSKNIWKLTCPQYYEPAAPCQDRSKEHPCPHGGSGEVYVVDKDGILSSHVKTNHDFIGRIRRYVKLCKRKMFTKEEDILNCCENRWSEEPDHINST